MKTLKMDVVKRIAFVVNLAGLYAIPSEYCLENLNKSNCNVSPKQVFYYYKPGSRCEIGTWKGCPTLNKFDTEEECANTCIYRDRSYYYPHIEEKLKANAICYKPINNKNCTGNYTIAFIYDNVMDKCVPINWGGCPHAGNVFQEKLDCLKTCFGSNWNERIKEITKEQSDQVDTILDNFLNNSNINEVSTSKSVVDVTLKGKLETPLNDNIDNETTIVASDELETTTVLRDIIKKEDGTSKEFHDTTTITPENVIESVTTSELADNSATEAVTDTTESTITTQQTTHSTPTTTPARTGTAKEVILPRDIDDNNY